MFITPDVEVARLCFFSSFGLVGIPATAESTFVSGSAMVDVMELMELIDERTERSLKHDDEQRKGLDGKKGVGDERARNVSTIGNSLHLE